MKTYILILLVIISNFIYSQTDWTWSSSGIPSNYVAKDFAVSSNGDVYLACWFWEGASATPKLFKSSNNGSDWNEISMSGITNVESPQSITFSGNKMLMSAFNSTTSTHEVYASNNNGQSWTWSSSGVPSNYVAKDFAVSSNGDVYLACWFWEGASATPKLFKSSNNGSDWNEISMSGITNVESPQSIIFSGNKMLMSAFNSVTSTHEVYASNYNPNSIHYYASLQNNYEISPNPSSNFITVKNISKNNIEIEKIEIISTNGTILKEVTKSFTRMNISDLPNELYLLKIYYSNSFDLIKIIKN